MCRSALRGYIPQVIARARTFFALLSVISQPIPRKRKTSIPTCFTTSPTSFIILLIIFRFTESIEPKIAWWWASVSLMRLLLTFTYSRLKENEKVNITVWHILTFTNCNNKLHNCQHVNQTTMSWATLAYGAQKAQWPLILERDTAGPVGQGRLWNSLNLAHVVGQARLHCKQ